jgi:hypothetical protein
MPPWDTIVANPGAGEDGIKPPWPDPPTSEPPDPRLLELQYMAQLREAAALRAQARAAPPSDPRAAVSDKRHEASLADDRALYKDLYDAYLEVAKGSVTRAQASATALSTAAGAIGTLYAAVLGVAFSVKDSHPLPARGVIPALFLGAAIALAAAYGGVLRRGRPTADVYLGDTFRAQQEARLVTFTRWTSELAARNAWALYAAVLCLGVGVASLPLPFLAWKGPWPWWGTLIAFGVIAAGTVVASRLFNPAPPLAKTQTVLAVRQDGAEMTVTAVVSNIEPEWIAPSGTVTFRFADDRRVVRRLDYEGKASLARGDVPAEATGVTAEYSGDQRNHKSASAKQDLGRPQN